MVSVSRYFFGVRTFLSESFNFKSDLATPLITIFNTNPYFAVLTTVWKISGKLKDDFSVFHVLGLRLRTIDNFPSFSSSQFCYITALFCEVSSSKVCVLTL